MGTSASSNYYCFIRFILSHIVTTNQPGSIGSALGKQSGKIMNFTALMEKELENYHDVLQQQQQQQQTANGTDGTIGADTAVLLEEIAAKHNELREHALKSRWELTVHRQAAGFIVNNYQDVDKYHPIGAKLTADKPVRMDDGVDGASASSVGTDVSNAEERAAEKPAVKKFGDQLDWWQEIGRWRGG
jgi:lysozyme family protein